MPQDLSNVKKMLAEMLQKKQQDKVDEESTRKAKNESDRNKILENISGDLAESLKPVLADLAKNSKLSTDDIRQALVEAIHISMPEMKIPEVKIPSINVPQPKVTVNVPKADAPVVHVSPTPVTFPSEMSLKPNSKPFPVIMMDQAGKPFVFSQQMNGGATGGRSDFFTIKDIQTSTGASIISDSENAIRITGTVTTSGSVSSTLAQMVNRDGSFYDSGTGFPVNIVGNVATLDVKQMSGDVSSVVVNSGTITTVTTLTGITNSIASSLVDSSGVQYSGSNALPVYIASGSSASTAVVALDRDGNPLTTGPIGVGDAATALRVLLAGDAVGSVYVQNPVAQGDSATALRIVHAGDVIVSTQTNNVAMTTLPTAAADAGIIYQKSDKLGRTLNRPVNVRELIATAYASITTGTEVTLLTATAGQYLDLIYAMATNSSDAAVTVDLRAVNAGNIETSIRVPANGTAGVALPVPIPQSATGNAWTAKIPDITGTTVTISTLFSKES